MENDFSWSQSNNSNSDNTGASFLHFSKYFEEELNFWIATCVIHAVVCFTAILGNSLILITIWKTSSLHSAANILLASLAVSDLAVGLIVQPIYIGGILSRIQTVFVTFNIVGSFLSIASFINITAIGIDRLLVLQLHLRYHAVVTPFRVTVVVIFIWVISGVFASVRSWSLTAFYTAPPTTFISLLVVNFAVYLKIYLIVRRHQRQIEHQYQQQQQQQQQQENNIFRVRRFKKTVLNTFLVYILLLCCYVPYSIVTNLVIAGVNFSPSFYVTTATLVFLNSSLNPLLYCWRDREIRTAVKQLF
ncbi:histamine H2 receptor-like [Oculina patagonica]